MCLKKQWHLYLKWPEGGGIWVNLNTKTNFCFWVKYSFKTSHWLSEKSYASHMHNFLTICILQKSSICVLTTWQWVNRFWLNYSFKELLILKAAAPGPEIEMRVEKKIGTLRGRRVSSVRGGPMGSWDGWINRKMDFGPCMIELVAWMWCGALISSSWPIRDMLSSPAGGRHSSDTVWYLKGLSEDIQIIILSQFSVDLHQLFDAAFFFILLYSLYLHLVVISLYRSFLQMLVHFLPNTTHFLMVIFCSSDTVFIEVKLFFCWVLISSSLLIFTCLAVCD